MSEKKIKLFRGIKTIITLFAIYGLVQLFISSTSIGEQWKADDNKQNTHLGFDAYNATPSISAPKNMVFSGETVPLHNPEVYERFDREIISNTFFHSNTIQYFKKANRWFPIIEPILKKNNVPDDFKYLALIESGLENVVSPAGASGFWQFMEATAKKFDLEINDEVDERYHLEKSTEAACKYLTNAYKRYGNWTLAAASYNAGKNRISTELEKQKVDSYYQLLLNNETKRYVFRILAIKELLNNPEVYGFKIKEEDLYSPIPYTIVKVDTSIADLVDFAKSYNISYKTLKYFNPWLRKSYLKNLESKEYMIRLPMDKNYYLN